ncbi:MAG: hydrolase [Lentisphaerae bacterium RIFOXYC12_FULL_60_16]|nr:MAG: hydrolase [Lentisphaerae bacterium RIFOXYC12_FULL_60_16]OGV74672.1 MAG: hydrolase [Lentisphaerae bacterium RIFOXYA12_FULL_60_10]OGV78508.1 MAG: hydrolase [Lentisphaerae bacterium RIFOXYB12_FULL_60_10]
MNTQDCALVVIDIQGRLAELMDGKDALIQNLERLIQGVNTLHIPIVWMEQNPTRMGPTIGPLKGLLAPLTPIPKLAFSCCGEPAFMDRIHAIGRRHLLLAGIEAHVCVYQTACDLLRAGYSVSIVADGVSSRTADNRQIGLAAAHDAGARITSVEMALFELLKTAGAPEFKTILNLVK